MDVLSFDLKSTVIFSAGLKNAPVPPLLGLKPSGKLHSMTSTWSVLSLQIWCLWPLKAITCNMQSEMVKTTTSFDISTNQDQFSLWVTQGGCVLKLTGCITEFLAIWPQHQPTKDWIKNAFIWCVFCLPGWHYQRLTAFVERVTSSNRWSTSRSRGVPARLWSWAATAVPWQSTSYLSSTPARIYVVPQQPPGTPISSRSMEWINRKWLP